MNLTKIGFLLAILVGSSILPAATTGQQHTQRGAVLGGLAGAITGAAIGKQNGETTEGALIGGALGLITGTAIGSSLDEQAARTQAIQRQNYWRMTRAVSVQDVVTMTQNGLSSDVIINHIRQNGVQRQLEVADVIFLHQQGVNQQVITAMQQASTASVYPATPSRYRAPVIVEEHHYIAPPYYYRPHYHYHHDYYHHHWPHYDPGFHWGITIGH